MTLQSFALCVLVPAVLVLAVLIYLRPVLIAVLVEFGVSAQGAEFWLRSATVLALIGSVCLVLLFGDVQGGRLGDVLRRVLIWSLLGSFASIGLIARLVWRARPVDCASRTTANGDASCVS
ncbi:MAG TPA: hypothetical protein VLC92_04365 [Rhodocyclaceae bacterium]|nr:hypothetical protein [Rhodocyclaceae bacterium]